MHVPETKIQLKDIREALKEIVKFFEKDFIKDLMKENQKSKPAKLISHRKKYGHLVPSARHPLAELWDKGFSNYKQLISRNRQFVDKSITVYYSLEIGLSQELLELFDIGTNLKEIENIPIISETGEFIEIEPMKYWRHRLQDPIIYEKAIYEIKVAASMKRNGYKVFSLKRAKRKLQTC